MIDGLIESLNANETLAEEIELSIKANLVNALDDWQDVVGLISDEFKNKIASVIYQNGNKTDELRRTVKLGVDLPIARASRLVTEAENTTGLDSEKIAFIFDSQPDITLGGQFPSSPTSVPGGDSPPPPGPPPSTDGPCPAEHGLYLELRCLPDGNIVPVCSCLYDKDGPPLSSYGDTYQIIGPFSNMNDCISEQMKYVGKRCEPDQPPPGKPCAQPDMSKLKDCLGQCQTVVSPPPPPTDHILTGMKCCEDGSVVTVNCVVKGIPHVESLDKSWCWWLDGVFHAGIGPFCPNTPTDFLNRCYKEPTCGYVPPPPPPPPTDGGDDGQPPPPPKKEDDHISCWLTLEDCPDFEADDFQIDNGCLTTECSIDHIGEVEA